MYARMLGLVAGSLLVTAMLVGAPGDPAPLMPHDLLAVAKDAVPEVATVLRELAVPADAVVLTDGTRLRVEPVSELLRPGDATTYSLRVLADADPKRAVAGSDIAEVRYFEKDALDRIATLQSIKTIDAAWAAEKAVRATLRYSLSRRQAQGPANHPWAALQHDLADRLLDARVRLLQQLAERDDPQEALTWADIWLSLHGAESQLGKAVRAVWLQQADRLLKSGKAPAARAQLDRIEETFPHHADAEPLRQELRSQAEKLAQQARDLPDAKAIPPLQQALATWPRLPGLRDELEKRKGTYQVLYVAVRELPEYLSPALAFTDAERQALELIFEGLAQAHYDPRLGPTYHPVLAESLPAGAGVRRPLRLRHDVTWPSGERFTAADVRHTVELLRRTRTADAAPWNDVIEPPRLDGNPYHLQLVYQQGLLDPWAPWQIKILPQQPHGKALQRVDDPEFAVRPVGTGPYQLQGKEGADGRVYLILRANPQFIRHGQAGPGSVREIRFFAWKAGDADPGQPLPHLVLDVLPGQVAALKKHGYQLHGLPQERVWFLGVNHRRPALDDVNVRLALAQAIDRGGLLARHFAGPGEPHTLNGPFPRGSYALASNQRVPEELYRPDDARASARKAGQALAKVEWTLKYPAGDPRLDAAFKELAAEVGKVLAAAEAHVTIRPVPLPPRQLQAALRDRDFDLVYAHLDRTDSPDALWPLFDPHPDAVSPAGSNYLGYDQDAQLQSLLRSALHHRNFLAVRDFMQSVHARLHTTMPLIPLWQLPYPIARHGKLQADDLDALAVFSNVLTWKVRP